MKPVFIKADYIMVFNSRSTHLFGFHMINEKECIVRASTSEYAAGYLPLCGEAMVVGKRQQWSWQGNEDHFQKFLI